MVRAHRRPQHPHEGVRGGLPADADRYSAALRRRYHPAHELEDRRVGGLVERCHGVVAAVGRHRVLDKVVGAYREEVGVPCDGGGVDGGGGHLDHRAHLEGAVIGDAFPVELAFRLFEDLGGGLELVDAGDHRVHQADVPRRRRAEHGPQLRAEDAGVGQEIAYRAVAQERIGLAPKGVLAGEDAHHLVAAYVKGAYCHRGRRRKRRRELGRLAVCGGLLVLGGLALGVEPEVLAPVQAYAARPLPAYAVERDARVDVGEQWHLPFPAESAGRAPADGKELLRQLLLPLDEVAEAQHRLAVRRHGHHSRRAVQQHGLAGPDNRGYVAQPRDRRDAHRPRQQRHVARRGSAVGGEAKHQVARKLHRLGRRQVVGHDYRRRAELEVRVGREAHEGLEKPPLHVVEVADAFAEVRVVHARELCAGPRYRLLDG